MDLFSESNLKPELLKALDELGFVTPTPVQAQSIPFLLNSSRDLLALAQTGTGKTAAFSLPILNQANEKEPNTQAIILCPTRELCLQIGRDLEAFSKYNHKLSTVAVYGGASIETQIRQLDRGAQIVVGTPGRVIDLIKRNKLRLQKVNWVVLDEADEMLSMGFQDDLDTILAETPTEKQTMLFSATMPKQLEHLTRKYMDNAHTITTARRNEGAETVQHMYYMVQASNRYLALKRIVDVNPNIYGIVFCRTRKETQEVADHLMQDGYNADSLHGDLSQAQRDLVMQKFRSRHLQLLVATDVAARGLDVNDLSHVINYNLPEDSEVYVHRSGRTGRAGKSGVSISIIHSREQRKIQIIEKMIGKRFQRTNVPNGPEICEKQLFNLIDRVEKIEVNEEQIERFLPTVFQKLEWLSREELIKHFLSVEFNRFLAYYENAPDLNIELRRERDNRDNRDYRDGRDNRDSRGPRQSRSTRGSEGRFGGRNFENFHINIGSKHTLNPSKLISLVNKHLRQREANIGKVEVLRNFSFFEIESEFSQQLQDSFSNVLWDGEPVVLERAGAATGGNTRGGGNSRGPRTESRAPYRGSKPDRRSTDKKRKPYKSSHK